MDKITYRFGCKLMYLFVTNDTKPNNITSQDKIVFQYSLDWTGLPVNECYI